MADAPTIIRIIFYLPGEMARRVVVQASEVFVRFLGGDVTLVQDLMRNRELQHVLRQKDPDHWARLFGEHVEQAESSAAARTGADVAPDNAASGNATEMARQFVEPSAFVIPLAVRAGTPFYVAQLVAEHLIGPADELHVCR